jgi:AbrB family looped-hinge helix DNA binding protein
MNAPHKTYKAKISPQGQITIPKELRQKIKLIKGESAVYISVLANGSVQIEPTASIQEFYGSLRPEQGQPSAAETVHLMRRKEQQKALERL